LSASLAHSSCVYGDREFGAPACFKGNVMSESQSQHSCLPAVAIESQECPKCRGPMMLSRIMPGRLKFDVRTFECVKCDQVEKALVAIDPIRSHSVRYPRMVSG
jgi:hypothetical protein